MQTPTKAPMPNVDSTLREERLPTHRIKPLYRTTQIVWYIVGLLEILLALRFFLKLFAANSAAGFSKFIYGATEIFAGPFLIVFQGSRVNSSVFEWSTLLAMAVYFLIGLLIVKALVMSKPVSTKEADQKLPGQEKL
ncbi:MAG: hypothetical protein WC787_00510 [Patescibacteria group bacterium]